MQSFRSSCRITSSTKVSFLRVESRSDERAGFDPLAGRELDACGAAATRENRRDFDPGPDLAPVLANIARQRLGQSRRSADAHLRRVRSSQQRSQPRA